MCGGWGRRRVKNVQRQRWIKLTSYKIEIFSELVLLTTPKPRHIGIFIFYLNRTEPKKIPKFLYFFHTLSYFFLLQYFLAHSTSSVILSHSSFHDSNLKRFKKKICTFSHHNSFYLCENCLKLSLMIQVKGNFKINVLYM